MRDHRDESGGCARILPREVNHRRNDAFLSGEREKALRIDERGVQATPLPSALCLRSLALYAYEAVAKLLRRIEQAAGVGCVPVSVANPAYSCAANTPLCQ